MTQYLILHKVRGEPSFDCAVEIEPDMWITNSGYRAYPYKKWSLDDLFTNDRFDVVVPDDWPDHFEVRKEPKMEINLGDILSGLIGKFPRRA